MNAPPLPAAESFNALAGALSTVPAGRWLIGVSGGADSVALLRALHTCRPDVEVTVAHLNHESRDLASEVDAAFVQSLAREIGANTEVARLSQFAPPPTRSHEAAYRHARFQFFSEAARRHGAIGVLLAHHADDRAETTMLRLLRGGEPSALGGLRREATLGTLRVSRPLMGVRRAVTVNYLATISQSWREDESNASMRFARNRVRRFLFLHPNLVGPLLALADAADALRDWTTANTPKLNDSFAAERLAELPNPLARSAARRWLERSGCEVRAVHVEGLIAMCHDASLAPLLNVPGGRIRRAAGRVCFEKS